MLCRSLKRNVNAFNSGDIVAGSAQIAHSSAANKDKQEKNKDSNAGAFKKIIDELLKDINSGKGIFPDKFS